MIKMVENCKNPWRECDGTDIELYIMHKDKQLPICNKCWKDLTEGRFNRKEWGLRRRRKKV